MNVIDEAEEAVRRYERMLPRERADRLKRSGIEVLASQGRRDRELGLRVRYDVEICCLQAIRIKRRDTSGMGGAQESVLDREAASTLFKRIERLATKTLYTVGLDHGAVRLEASGKCGCSVISIDPRPWKGMTDLSAMYRAGWKQLQSELDEERHRNAAPILGMDPEFLLVQMPESKIVPASRFLERTGVAGCDSVTIGGRRIYPVAELRPAPSSEPRELLAHLMRAFAAASRSISDHSLIWQAGGMPQRGLPLGGHVHFSGVTLNGELLRALDNYLALPLAVLQDPRGSGRRPRYGALGDFRLKSYGGFEYRTLPSFLVSPLVAKGVVALAGLIARGYHQLRQRPLAKAAVHTAFYEGNREVMQAHIPALLDDLTQMDGYERYERYAAPLISQLRQGRTWDESRDIRKLWNIRAGS
ncbi:putative amidoligase domain-containing protein [Paenibacillus taichungensis]|uniref:putative amidoligase domain-containing protein n=1 Tax=Paenibacillus taichungensis TaxID=484184 RepID=UPI0039A57BD8